MMGKQTFVDAFIVLLVPALLIGAYYLWFKPDESVLLLSAAPNTVAEGSNELGAKTKLALKTLKSISLDDSLFKDPAYLALKTYTITIPSVPVARPFPFSSPPAILERVRQVRAGTLAKPTTTATKPATSGPAKIDALLISPARPIR